MAEHILVGRGSEILRHSTESWRAHLAEAARVDSPHLAFMTREHHLVRDAAVRELPRAKGPLSPESLSEKTGIPGERVRILLDELESRLFFLVRDGEGRVSWAFPVTTEPTPHRLRFSTGETIYAA